MPGEFDVPSAEEITKLHRNADTDGDARSAHHTLGARAGQAAPGNHSHDGGTSVLLLDGTTISGSRGTSTAVVSIIAALVQLGATDATTA